MQCQTVLPGAECTFWGNKAVYFRMAPARRWLKIVKDVSALLPVLLAKSAAPIRPQQKNGTMESVILRAM